MDKIEVPSFYFCICNDAYLSKQHMDTFLNSLGKPWSVDSSTNNTLIEKYTYWPEDLSEQKFWNTMTLQNLTGTPKLIYVRHAHSILADDWKKLSATLATTRNGILPVFFFECAWEKGIPKIPAHITKLKCFEFATSKKWEFRSIGLNEKNIKAFLFKELQKHAIVLNQESMEMLAFSIIPDATLIASTVSHLALLAENGTISKKNLAQLNGYVPELQIFDLIKDIENSNGKKIWALFAKDNTEGEDIIFSLIALMSREARMLWQLLMGEHVYIAPTILDSKKILAKRLGATGLSTLFTALTEAEFAIKSGKYSVAQTFDFLLVTLCDIFSKKRMIHGTPNVPTSTHTGKSNDVR